MVQWYYTISQQIVHTLLQGIYLEIARNKFIGIFMYSQFEVLNKLKPRVDPAMRGCHYILGHNMSIHFTCCVHI